MIEFTASATFRSEALILLMSADQVRHKKFNDLKWPSLKTELAGLTRAGHFEGRSGQVFPLSAERQTVLLVGLGDEAELTATALRVATRQAILSPFVKKARTLELILCHARQDDTSIIAMIEGIVIGGYAWTKYKTQKPESPKFTDKKFTIIAESKRLYRDAAAACLGVTLCRDLVNDNADLVHAGHIEKTVKGLLRGKKNVTCTVLGRAELKRHGLGLHLAVNQGSAYDPKLIIVQYRGSSHQGFDLALIGKGITFDTGGLNLKPSGHLETMRSDMSGTAAVIGTLRNILALGVRKNILFVCAIAENAIGSHAYKPGDVYRAYNGKTVEIGNTDAEGRLVLADAIAYIGTNYRPKAIIDIATLTGACVVALGFDYTGLLSSHDDLAQQIITAGEETDDRVWRLPLYPELKGVMDSPIADLKNTSNIKGAGTITGAFFLKQFVPDGTAWAHLDIAGTSFVDKGSRMYFGQGATGAGVRLLTRLLRTS